MGRNPLFPGVPQGTPLQGFYAGRLFRGQCHRRAAARAELEPDPAMAFVGVVLIGRKRAAADLEVLVPEVGHNREGAASAMLAVCAMAYRYPRGPVLRPVANRTAKTASFVDLRHRRYATLATFAVAGSRTSTLRIWVSSSTCLPSCNCCCSSCRTRS